jgi:hypothetical protein
MSIPGGMEYWTVSADKYVPNLSGGLGLMATGSREGFIQSTNIAAQYSFEICNDINEWELRLGPQAGVGNRRIDYKHLVFSDQIDNTGIIPGAVSGADVVVITTAIFWMPAWAHFFFIKMPGRSVPVPTILTNRMNRLRRHRK